MVVTVTATTTSGRPLSPDALAKALQGCEMTAQLDADKQKVIRGGAGEGLGGGLASFMKPRARTRHSPEGGGSTTS
jgi:hypothetical protein